MKIKLDWFLLPVCAGLLLLLSCPGLNSRPVAVAGEDCLGYVGYPCSLNGSRSLDADNDKLTFSWSVVSVPQGSAVTTESIGEPGKAHTSFVPDAAGQFTLRLKVSDAYAFDEDDIIISAVNEIPPYVAIESEGVYLNEIYLDYPYVFEFYNTGDHLIDMSAYSLRIEWLSSYEYIVSIPTGATIPADGYFLLHQYTIDYFIDTTGLNCLQATASWSISSSLDFAVTLLYNNTPVDFVQGNTLDYTVPEGLTWETQLDLDGPTLARTTIDPEGALDQQWERSYGTLGYDNTTTGQADTAITIY